MHAYMFMYLWLSRFLNSPVIRQLEATEGKGVRLHFRMIFKRNEKSGKGDTVL